MNVKNAKEYLAGEGEARGAGSIVKKRDSLERSISFIFLFLTGSFLLWHHHIYPAKIKGLHLVSALKWPLRFCHIFNLEASFLYFTLAF